MNAPANAADLEQPQVEHLPLTAIALSETHVQAERRKAYNDQALEELARSILDSGVLQPIVVRPLEAMRGLAKYELVAGERRWRASQKLGHSHILARILPLTDGQVLKAQLVENLHREKLDTLAEAQGFRELMDMAVPPEAIASMIGLSRSYVYARVKLLSLSAPVKEALTAGEIDASQALLFARIPSDKLQEQSLNTLRKWSYQGHGERLSFRRTAEILRDKAKGAMIPLHTVPFRLDDATFYTFGPKQGKHQAQDMLNLPACIACPKRSGNDPELLAALDDADVCTDRFCHDVKAKQAFERRRKEAEASGREILTGEAAAAIAPTQWGTRGYFDLDEACSEDRYPEPEPKQASGESDEAFEARFSDWDERSYKWEQRTYRQLLGDAIEGLEIKLVQDPRSKQKLRELAPDKEVAKLLKDKGINLRNFRDTSKPAKAAAPEKPKDPEAARKAEEKRAREAAAEQLAEAIDTEYHQRLLKLVHEKYKPPFARDDLELIAEEILQSYDAGQTAAMLFGKRPSLGTMNERDLARTIMALLVGMEYTNGGTDRAMVALAKRLKLDPKALEKQVRNELTPKPEGAPAKKLTAGKAKGKKK